MVDDTTFIDLLDVSEAQGVIDWPRVAAAQVAPGIERNFRGAIVKVAEKETYKDPRRLTNIHGARGAGLLVGGYLFFHPMGDAEKQAENAWQAIGDTTLDFPLSIDVEVADPSLSPQQLIDATRRLRDAVVARFGRLPIFYTYPNFVKTRLMPALAGATDLAEMMLWMAFYGAGKPWYPREVDGPPVFEPWTEWSLWQYSGNGGMKVPGIYGGVDRNILRGGEEALRKLRGLGPALEDQPVVHPAIDQ